MDRDPRRILTTHVGSLIRPPALVEFLRAKLFDEPYDEAAYGACLRMSVARVVRQQAEIGLDIVNDGEFGKSSWFRYIGERLSGFTFRVTPGQKAKGSPSSGNDFERFRDFYTEYNSTREPTGPAGNWVVAGPVAYKGQAAVQRDIDNFKHALGQVRAEAGFLPVVAPASATANLKDEYYGDDEKLIFALADALRDEYRAIADAGLIVQVDDAWLTAMHDHMVPPWTMAQYRDWAELRVAALNRALDGIPEERTRYHICWGSWNGPHVFDVPIRDILPLLMKIKVGAYSFEAANPRHGHEWQAWKTVKVPKGKALMPGVVTHSTNIVEHPELVAERLMHYASIVGKENVMAGTDCGFAQSPFARRVHPTIQWAKLEALAEGAKIASKRLWGKAKPKSKAPKAKAKPKAKPARRAA